jgi:hypothetical protein
VSEPAVSDAETTPPADGINPPGGDNRARERRFGWVVPVLALIWLPIMLWASYGSIHTSGGGSIAVATAAEALPGVVQATFAGALGAAILATSAVRGRSSVVRWITSLAGGLVIGLVAAAVILSVYGHAAGLLSVEVAIAVVGVIGGAFAGPLAIRNSVAAGLAGLLTALVAYRILVAHNVLTHTIKWFGAGDTIDSYLHASSRVAYFNSAIAGILAGYISYRVLKRADRSARFPSYQLAGAFAGVALLVCELVTRIGGANLLDVVRSISPEDRTLFDLVRPANLNNDLLVLFVGAIVAVIAFGRSLGPARAVAPPPVDTDG